MTELKLREQIQLDAGILSDKMWQGSRITGMLNQAQNWLQQQLIKTGSNNFKKELTISISSDTLQGVTCGKGSVPSDWLKDMPIEQLYPSGVSGTANLITRPFREIEVRNWVEIIKNLYTTPVPERAIFTIVDAEIFVFPASITTVDAIYTRKILDLVFDNDSTASEIPIGMLGALVDRVVTQINVVKGGAQLTQLTIEDIDKRIAQKYQLDQLKEEKIDRKVIQ